MLKWLSQEWLDKLVEMAKDQPERPGASLRIQYVITDWPDGSELRYWWLVNDGKLEDAKLGDMDSPEVTLTMTMMDHKRIQTGELDANSAFIQGRIKVTGNMARLMGLLPITNSPEYVELQNKMVEITEF